jgi:hypothetical protein
VFIAFLITVPSIAGQETLSAPRTKPYVDPDAYSVYAALLASQGEKSYVIEPEMDYTPDAKTSGIQGRPEFTKVWGDALDDYVDKLHVARTLTHDIPLEAPYELVPKNDIEVLFKSSVLKGWREFNTRHPGARGFYWFSAVGFDKNKTHAVVFMNNRCGGMCGQGSPRILEKVDGKWREAKVDVDYSVWWFSFSPPLIFVPTQNFVFSRS